MRSPIDNPLPKSATFAHDTIQSINADHLANELKTKKNLNLSSIHMSDSDAKMLFTAMLKNDSIETVDLSQCKLSEKALNYFFKLMRTNKKIHTLILNDATLTPQNIEQISRFLSDNTGLKTLSLKNCYLGEEGTRILVKGFVEEEDMDDVTVHNNTLEKLDLENTGLDSHYANLLLKIETNLRNLNFSNNNLKESAIAIVRRCSNEVKAPFGNKITTLNLSHNNITDEVCSEVLQELQNNPRIHTFSMDSDKYVTKTNQEVRDQIEMIVKKNKPATPTSPLIAHSRFAPSEFIPGKIAHCRGEKGVYIFYPETFVAENYYRAMPDSLKADNTIMLKNNIIFIANASGGTGVYDLTSGQGKKQSAIQCTDNAAAQQVKELLFKDVNDVFIRPKQKTETVYCDAKIFGKMPRGFNEDDFVNTLGASKGFGQ